GGLRLCQLHLPHDGADDQHVGIAADLFADMLPAPALLAFDVEQLLGEVFAFHVALLYSSCPALCRASTYLFRRTRKTWMAGTGPAMTPVLNPRLPKRSPVPVCP